MAQPGSGPSLIGPMTPKTDIYLKVVSVGEPILTRGTEVEHASLLPEKDMERKRFWHGEILMYEGIAVDETAGPYYRLVYWDRQSNWSVKVVVTFFGNGESFDQFIQLPVAGE